MLLQEIIINNYIILIMMQQSVSILDYFYTQSFDVKSETSTQGQQAQFTQECLGNSHLNHTYRGGSSKAKSSLCKNFMEKGYCPYGNKCQFAHGPHELKINMEHNRSYKTKGCHAFAKKGYCCYGSRCNFIHNQETQFPSQRQKWSIIYSNNRDFFQSINKVQGSKLMHILKL